jgi:hypothetical protein
MRTWMAEAAAVIAVAAGLAAGWSDAPTLRQVIATVVAVATVVVADWCRSKEIPRLAT